MTVELLRIDDPVLPAVWDSMYAADHAATPFHSYDFTHAWWQVYDGSPKGKVLLAQDRAGTPAALIPLRFGVGEIRTLFTNAADYTGSVCRPHGNGARELATHLVSRLSNRRLRLWNVRADDPLVLALRSVVDLSDVQTETMMSADAGDTAVPGTQYPMGSSFRQQVRKDQRRLLRLGVEHIDVRGQEVAHHLAEMIALHTATWEARGLPGKFVDGRRRGLLRRLVELGDRFPCRFTALLHRKEALAFRFGFLRRGTEYFWTSGFLPRFRGYSPGQVLLLMDTQRLADPTTDVSVIDFLRGDEDYKRRWASQRAAVHAYEAPARTGLRR